MTDSRSQTATFKRTPGLERWLSSKTHLFNNEDPSSDPSTYVKWLTAGTHVNRHSRDKYMCAHIKKQQKHGLFSEHGLHAQM